MLAPLLADMLTAFFQGGWVPSCVTSALVTPIHKKGSDLDTANYRPIAVGEPLYRLYAIILNKRLVDWTESVGVRSPAQAGFRPKYSTVHQLFALRHFVDRARLRQVPLYTCFIDIQKAYDSVQHQLLWARLRHVGVCGPMLAAIQSLYATGTISMKVGGTAGEPKVQQMGVRQGCPLSPTLFGIFFDGLHDHFRTVCPSGGLQLGSGRRVPFLCYADDVVLLSESGPGLQQLIDGMHAFCCSAGLTISIAKSEVVVFHGTSTGRVWSVCGRPLPQSQSFKYLGLVFHESGQADSMFHQLHRAGQGAQARLRASFAGLGCASSFPMKRRLFNTLVTPAASYGCEVWGTHSVGPVHAGMAKLLRVQAAFLRSLCGLPKTAPVHAVFSELAESPWDMRWWGQVVKFALRLKAMPEGALHVDVLQDNVQDALGNRAAGNWAGHLVKHFHVLGLPLPFARDGSVCIDFNTYQNSARQHSSRVWEGLHVSPRTCPSKGAKLCTYHRWFARQGPVQEPYYDLPLSNLSVRRLFRFRLGAHHLPVEMGRRGGLARVARVCPACTGGHVGDERHLVFECPAFQHVRRRHAGLYTDARSTMRLFMWHRDQKGVASCLLQLLSEYDALLT